MKRKTVRLDVRDDIRSGKEPFGKIMQAVSSLGESEDLLLIAPFEPAPLFSVLAARGFSHESAPLDNGDYEVRFSRAAAVAEPARQATGAATKSGKGRACTGTPVLEVDARGLEPPEPLVKILEAVADLPGGARLRARTDRRPMHLYAQLEERGFVGETEEQTDGSFVTHIQRR